MTEEWRPVAGAPDYEVSSLGSVRSLKGGTPRLLNPGTNPHGYRTYILVVDGRRAYYSGHALVMAAFIGPRPEGMDTRHLDGDPGNNAVENLRYGTKSENALDRVRHGTDRNARKTECPSGHPYDELNTRVSTDGFRRCRRCERERARKYYARKRAA